MTDTIEDLKKRIIDRLGLDRYMSLGSMHLVCKPLLLGQGPKLLGIEWGKPIWEVIPGACVVTVHRIGRAGIFQMKNFI